MTSSIRPGSQPTPRTHSATRASPLAFAWDLEAHTARGGVAPQGGLSTKTRRVAFPPPRRAFSLSGQRQARASVCIPCLLDFGTGYRPRLVEPAPRQMTSYSTGASNGNCTARRIPRASGPRRSGSLAPPNAIHAPALGDKTAVPEAIRLALATALKT